MHSSVSMAQQLPSERQWRGARRRAEAGVAVVAGVRGERPGPVCRALFLIVLASATAHEIPKHEYTLVASNKTCKGATQLPPGHGWFAKGSNRKACRASVLLSTVCDHGYFEYIEGPNEDFRCRCASYATENIDCNATENQLTLPSTSIYRIDHTPAPKRKVGLMVGFAFLFFGIAFSCSSWKRYIEERDERRRQNKKNAVAAEQRMLRRSSMPY